jgi:L-rhamnose isomerase
MNKDSVLKLAGLAGFEVHEGKFDDDVYVDGVSIYNQLKLFVELIRADEREACAAVAYIALLGYERSIRDRVVRAIRAGGEK